MKTIVFSEDTSLLYELITAGRKLGNVSAIVIGSEEDARVASEHGADIFWFENNETFLDNYVPAIANVVNENAPDLFLVGATVKGKMVAGRIAAKLNTSAVTAAKNFEVDHGAVIASQMIYGGGAIRTLKANGKTLVALVKPGIAETQKNTSAGKITQLIPQMPKQYMKCREIKAIPPTNDGVLTAKKVVGVGSGFSSNEEIGIARELAAALEGELGYTRPMVEGDPPIVPNNPYIGITGIQIKPELFIACGISGQTQHVVGINESKVVACINNDPNAPIFRHSDYGIVGDMFEIIPALTKAIKDLK